MKKRITIVFITIGIILALIPNAGAAPAKGGWVLKEVNDQGPKKDIKDFDFHCNRGEFNIHWDIEWREPTGTYGVTKETIDGTPTTVIDIGGVDRRTQGHISMVYTGLPERAAPGETVTLTCNFSREAHGDDTDSLLSTTFYKGLGMENIHTYVNFRKGLSAGLEEISETGFKFPYLSHGEPYNSVEKFSLTFPQGREEDTVSISLYVSGSFYALLPSGPPVILDELRSTFVYEYYGGASSLPGPVTQVEDKSPGDYGGEETTDIKTAAILGIAATVAAIAAAGASAASVSVAGASAAGSSAVASATVDVSTATQDAVEEAARQKIGDYRMVVYKSFGNTIRHGETNQYVVARIEYKDEQTGAWVFDAGRSDAISVTISQVKGLGLYPPPPNVTAPGKGYTIMLDNEKPEEAQATLSFKFTAPDGGFFQRNMVFQLSDAIFIRFF